MENGHLLIDENIPFVDLYSCDGNTSWRLQVYNKHVYHHENTNCFFWKVNPVHDYDISILKSI